MSAVAKDVFACQVEACEEDADTDAGYCFFHSRLAREGLLDLPDEDEPVMMPEPNGNGRQTVPGREARAAERFVAEARKKVGAVKRERRSWTPQQMVEALVGFTDKNGRPPAYAEFNKANGLPAVTVVNREFGAVARLFRAAGVDPVKRNGGRSVRKAKPVREATPTLAKAAPLVVLAQAVVDAEAALTAAKERLREALA